MPVEVPYAIAHPLENGPTIVEKRRAVSTPAGTSVVLGRDARGEWRVEVPEGTEFRKDFFARRDDGGLALLERRTLRRSGGAWTFATAHAPLPDRGLREWLAWLPVFPLREETIAPSAWRALGETPAAGWPERRERGPRWMSAPASDGTTRAHVFPGAGACAGCHGGAAAAFRAEGGASPVLAFALAPGALTRAAVAALVDARVLAFADATDRAAYEDAAEALKAGGTAAPARDVDALARRVADRFRHDCVSCHTTHPLALARSTAFVLDPLARHDSATLLAALSRRATRHGAVGLPLVTPGRPEESEIVLRLRGDGGRRRMPPREGGLPARHDALLADVTRWVEALR